MPDFSVHLSTEDECRTLPWVDFTTLDGLHTCPRYGLVTYVHGRRLYEQKPTDAVLAGAAAHRFFAAYNSYDNSALREKLFDAATLEQLQAAADRAEDPRAMFAIEAIYLDNTSPESSAKTFDKIEQSCIYWMRRQFVDREILGVEQAFSITVNDTFRYIGVIDCIQRTPKGTVIAVEYKTARRIDSNYRDRWLLSRQLTGYHIALRAMVDAGLFSGTIADYVELEAIQIPLASSRSADALPHLRLPVERDVWHYEEWLRWCQEGLAHKSHPSPHIAPTREACYRFNSICPLLRDFCAMDPETREEIFTEHMISAPWEPWKR